MPSLLDLVLTASHCRPAFPLDHHVYIGTFRQSELIGGAERIPVADRVLHPDYDDISLANDFMVVKLKTPVNNTDVLKPIFLNGDKTKPTRQEVLTTIGYGATSHGGLGSYFLKKVEVKYITNRRCKKLYSKEDINGSIMLCAGTKKGGKDSCQGGTYNCWVAGKGPFFALLSNNVTALHNRFWRTTRGLVRCSSRCGFLGYRLWAC